MGQHEDVKEGKGVTATTLVLVVMHPKRQRRLVKVLESSSIAIRSVGNCREAREELSADPAVDVVITDLTHEDGNWCDLLKWVVDRGLRVSLVVSCTAAIADAHLWSEVFWRGAYDLLGYPYQHLEVCRSVEGAARAARSGWPLPRSVNGQRLPSIANKLAS